MKLDEIVQPKPTKAELERWKFYDDSEHYGQKERVAHNQIDAFKANLVARLRELGINPKHFEVVWSSPEGATTIDGAKIRFYVKNKNSQMFKNDTEFSELFTGSVARALIKNAFKEIFGVTVKVMDADENTPAKGGNKEGGYANGARYLDYKVVVV